MPEEVKDTVKDKKNAESNHVLGSMVKNAEKESQGGKDKAEDGGDADEEKASKDARVKKKPAGKQEEKVIHTVTFDLTEEDFAAKGKQAAELQGQLDKLEYDFSLVKENHKASVTLLEQDCAQVLSCIRRGKEERDVECVKLIDFDLGLVEYWHKGLLVEKRGIKPDERQMRML